MFSFPSCSSNLHLLLCLELDKPEIYSWAYKRGIILSRIVKITYLTKKKHKGLTFQLDETVIFFPSTFHLPSPLISSLLDSSKILLAWYILSAWRVNHSRFREPGFFQEPLRLPSEAQWRSAHHMIPEPPQRHPAQPTCCSAPSKSTLSLPTDLQLRLHISPGLCRDFSTPSFT